MVLRLTVAGLCGGIIGYQRERVGKSAGLRTHILTAAGSALLIVSGVNAGMGEDALSRIVQGLVTGIGFLGGGAILKIERGRNIHGLTTAAGIWMTAAIGVAAGFGQFVTAVVAALLAWIVLDLLRRMEVSESE
jgi:putative Mg2+ transporter-C (MgtC) family protein